MRTYHRTKCRACDGPLRLVLDLGHSPLANSLSATPEEARALPWYPLRMCYCTSCWMVQLDVAIPSEELFSHYVYETPAAASLHLHYEHLIETIASVYERVSGSDVGPKRCVEMGSNNGEFLVAMRNRWDIPLLGIEPARNIVDIASKRGVPTVCEFFGLDTVDELISTFGTTDLFVARHCMAHLDDLRGTLCAIAKILDEDGVAVIENAYVMNTLRGGQFDQIYHEHHSYFAVRPMKRLLEECGLHLRYAATSPIHGGTVVLFASKKPGDTVHDSVARALLDEGMMPRELEAFAFRAKTCIAGLQRGLTGLGTIDSYGATAKGNTLMNVLTGAKSLVRYAVDSTPSKQGLFLPGTGIEVISEERAREERPDAYLLTAWNYAEEIAAKNREFTDRGGKFVVPLPFPRLA